jgi:hypothetical protein
LTPTARARRPGRKYGLVYLMYNTIVNLLTQDDQILCFENAVRHPTDDGAFVLECRVPTPPKRSGFQCVDAERLAADRVTLEVGRAHEPGRRSDDRSDRLSGLVESCDVRTRSSTPTFRPKAPMGCRIERSGS